MSAKPDVSYRNAALIVWDMQNGIAKRAFNFTEIVKNARLLIDSAHEHHIPVVYSQHTGLPNEYLSKYSAYSLQKRGIDPRNSSSFMKEGSEEWRIIDELAPSEDDLVFKKYTASFFTGTILEQILRNKNVTSIILSGVSTEGGIEGTARHGASLGFIPVVAQDAVGSFDQQIHERMLEIMRRIFEVEPTASIINRMGI
jgi:nicotinamidase-related amidase